MKWGMSCLPKRFFKWKTASHNRRVEHASEKSKLPDQNLEVSYPAVFKLASSNRCRLGNWRWHISATENDKITSTKSASGFYKVLLQDGLPVKTMQLQKGRYLVHRRMLMWQRNVREQAWALSQFGQWGWGWFILIKHEKTPSIITFIQWVVHLCYQMLVNMQCIFLLWLHTHIKSSYVDRGT